ncbi:zinc-ribbon domain-containing protein [Paenibacillus sp. NAIST15-1]|uniref:zinc-ribbon domain-containing protein n=1 Tax=Paenibacillus sp. NAIST15-1 TaxID=1605994 RepID=UPI0008697E34|nr:zinc-ribbon domain-containing protein [Paenibacillus sp. NAIST15-1]GAV11365.1 DNA-directed RNA polymerase subunit alpha [Paenibacillus sp. NAIST15-1]
MGNNNIIDQQSLLITNPEIVEHWDSSKNKGCTPDDVFSHSRKRIFWICEDGHTAFEPVRVRVKRGGCVECIRKVKKEIVSPPIEMRNTFYHLQKNSSMKLKDFFDIQHVPATPIEALVFIEAGSNRIRIYNVLRRYDIRTLEELLDCTFEEISRFRNLGEKSQKELFEILKEYLNEEDPDYHQRV